MTSRPKCPECGGKYVKRDGKTAGGEQRYKCKFCASSFTVEQQRVPPTKGSGVIALPCREREFRPLKRNIWEHMKLAMETRR